MSASLYDLVESRGSLPLLCYLNAHGPSTVYSLVHELKFGRDAVQHAIRVTTSLGLCREERSSAFPFSRTISLTSKGAAFLQTPLCEFPSFLWSGPASGSIQPRSGRKRASANSGSR